MTPQEVLMSTLRRALSLKRPHGSREEGMLLASLMVPELMDRTWVDAIGNLHIDLRTERHHQTLFVAHVDTVHYRGGVNRFDDSTPMWKAFEGKPMRKLSANGKPLINAKTKLPVYVSTRGEALGADDGAGVAMLAGLIAARKPGYYVFTRGEECGGIGAKFLADEQFDLLMDFNRAIAFDRRDVTSVITRQGGSRCCSDVFAEALSQELNDLGMLYMPDDTGVYTDTAEFTGIISECTNVSVGYYHEHSDRECLDTHHLQMLFGACLAIDFDKLPAVREPGDDDEILFSYGGYKGDGSQDTFGRGGSADAEPSADKRGSNDDEFDPRDPFAVDHDGTKFRRWMRENVN